jgi:hypothetical protein
VNDGSLHRRSWQIVRWTLENPAAVYCGRGPMGGPRPPEDLTPKRRPSRPEQSSSGFYHGPNPDASVCVTTVL